ncbi:MAG: phytanoyl-CoA dioxygenase family protein [Rhodanobacteraceae bacterium]
MTPEQILSTPVRVLSQAQREAYFEDGFIVLEHFIPDEWLRKLRAATDRLIERSRALGVSDAVFDLEPDHTSANPRLRRVTSPVDQDPVFWNYLARSQLADVVADLVGPDVKYHHSKLNFKWARGGEEVKWHYDISFWPHTNYSPLTVGTYLYDCDMQQGPVGFIPGSQKQPMATQYNREGKWIGCMSPADVAKLDLSKAKYMIGPAGSVTIHDCRTIHGSAVNSSIHPRPLLLYTLTAADAFPYTANPLPSRQYSGTVIRGKPARYARVEAGVEQCEIPPDWSRGYTSIFALQQEESAAAAAAM